MKMEQEIDDQVIAELNQLKGPDIPKFLLVRPFLYNIFVVETGPACTLILHYYVTGKRTNSDEKFLYDPCEQAKWCIRNLPYFSNVAKRLKQIRNKLAHHDYLTFTLFRDVINSIVQLSKKPNNVSFLINSFLNSIYSICRTILSEDKNISNFCPFCRSPILNGNYCIDDNSKVIVTNHVDQQKIIETNCAEDQQNDNNITYKTNIEQKGYSFSLKYWKENGWKDKLKGKTIKIMDGQWINYEGMFRSWAGTSCYVDLKGEGRKCLRLDTLIIIL